MKLRDADKQCCCLRGEHLVRLITFGEADEIADVWKNIHMR